MQRADIVRLRRRDPNRQFLNPCIMRSLGLGDTYVCEVGIDPGAVFISVQEGPVLLWSGLALYIV